MTTTDRNAMVESALDLVSWQASRFPRLPAGVSRDDLKSAGNEALIHAATTFDPDDARNAAGGGWRTYARHAVKTAMKGVIRQARTRRQVPLVIHTADGDELPRADPKATDPAQVAEARELVAAPAAVVRRRGRVSPFAGLPDPQQVATQAVALRDAMYAAVSADDVGDIMRAVVRKAKGGDLKATRLLLDTVLPGGKGSGTTIQQVVAIHQTDIG